MCSYLAKQQKYGLGGKTWTLLVGGLLSWTYIRYKERQEKITVPTANGTTADGRELFVVKEPAVAPPPTLIAQSREKFRSVCREHSSLVSFGLCGVVMSVWLVRCYGAFNRLMITRYGDIHYQIRRPDLIQEKLIAMKYLLLPASLPIVGGGLLIASKVRNQKDSRALGASHVDERVHAIFSSVFRKARDVFDEPMAKLEKSPHGAVCKGPPS